MHKTHENEERPMRALLAGITDNSTGRDDAESRSRELRGLAESLGLEIAACETIRVRERQPQFGMGSGKAAELAEKAKSLEADCLVFDWNPSPSQQRNWETLAGIPVIDRQELIIRIFAERANTREAELQVKLAELSYFLPRLSHKYIDLSRQRGGRYGTKGSGETRLETDRRRLEKRINQLQKEIKEVRKQREVQRRRRERQGLPVCAIVGYTNAGKSSLLNALTGAEVTVADKLFATLDATTRRFEPEPGRTALLTDTVGFIRQLPHSLIDAFRSTLEEAVLADILIHVLDASEPDIDCFYDTTLSVLRELGAEAVPMLTVLNKIDRPEAAARIEGLAARYPGCIAVSVKNGTGLDELKKQTAALLLDIDMGKPQRSVR
ncbi:MAG: GTPase HflX [Treponema sp.]|jgi:GTP-binding protein HflX|nr:GTPase HflX [Treponema sp.]